MCDLLQLNLVIEKIDLEGNNVESEGAICLANILKDNYTVTELVCVTLCLPLK